MAWLIRHPGEGKPFNVALIDCDEARLCQVVSNLLTNAANYTNRRGRLESEAMRLGHEPIEGFRAIRGFLGRTRLGPRLSAVSSQTQELVAGVTQ